MNITSLLQTILILFLIVLVVIEIEYLRRTIKTKKILYLKHEWEVKKEWALMAVEYTEQRYKGQNGVIKYNAACERLSTHAEDKGIKLSILEIEGLIESSVLLLKNKSQEE